MNEFNLIAPIYDRLSSFVFGRSMRQAQTLFLEDIPADANVLILGGGTGWLLAELLRVNGSCRVWYIEASSKMLELSKSKVDNGLRRVRFVHGTQYTIPQGIIFDAVITHCYLDLFTADSCQRTIQRITSAMREESLWLIADFLNTTWWQSALLNLMYKFFRTVSSVEAKELPPWRDLVAQNGFLVKRSRNFFGGFIFSALFRKA
jgi:tRNA (cmo5U34)-methyltransferase